MLLTMLLQMLLQMHAHACTGMRGSRACLKMRIVRGSCALARRRGREAQDMSSPLPAVLFISGFRKSGLLHEPISHELTA